MLYYNIVIQTTNKNTYYTTARALSRVQITRGIYTPQNRFAGVLRSGVGGLAVFIFSKGAFKRIPLKFCFSNRRNVNVASSAAFRSVYWLRNYNNWHWNYNCTSLGIHKVLRLFFVGVLATFHSSNSGYATQNSHTVIIVNGSKGKKAVSKFQVIPLFLIVHHRLRIHLRVISWRTSARTLRKWGLSLYGLAREWGKSSFSWKRARWPINFFSFWV